jgi:hypothetical protein
MQPRNFSEPERRRSAVWWLAMELLARADRLDAERAAAEGVIAKHGNAVIAPSVAKG